jgi:hypothetical protein
VEFRVIATIGIPFALALLTAAFYLLLPLPRMANVWITLAVESAVMVVVFVLLEALTEGKAIRMHLSWFHSTLRNPTSEQLKETRNEE